MDLHDQARARSHSAASTVAAQGLSSHHQQHHHQQPDALSRPQHSPRMTTSHSPSPGPHPLPDHVPSSSPSSLSLGLGGVGNPAQSQSQSHPQSQSFPGSHPDFSTPYTAFDLSQMHQQSFSSQLGSGSGYGATGADFTIFPPSSSEPQFNAPLFVSDSDASSMMTQVASSSDPALPSSSAHSPSYAHRHFSSPGGHSRNTSLGPEAALLSGQLLDWNPGRPQFQGHRRSPSEYSDVSSAAPSPNLVTADSFDSIDQSHSPVNQPQDVHLYQELHGIGTFSLSDQTRSPGHSVRSPSHSPAMSPRILPQQPGPDLSQPNGFLLPTQNNGYAPSSPYMQPPQEAFPQLPGDCDSEMQSAMLAPPSINIDFAPAAMKTGFEQPKTLDPDSLNPPERGRARISRPRAVTDPYKSGGGLMGLRTPSAGTGLSPQSAVDPRTESTRSLSPLDRSGSGIGALSPSRRRQSTSAVPNNIIALRLADPEYTGPGAQADTSGGGGTKRVQKHPATFQCSLCPKRFTRAYNLRSHLRTHTDERPFVCTVCGKAFARQHDRKRHEGLHSGEKKFVCKGDLKAGGQWGCGRRFARADALGRHFRSEAGRVCIRPLLDEEMAERQRLWNEQQMQQAAAQGMVPGMMMAPPPSPGMDPNAPFPMDASGNYSLPQALLAQYPALAQVNWSAPDMGGGSGMDDELSGRSSFDASDYDDAEDAGYVSGPGTGFGPGGLQEGFGEMGYASDYGGRT